MNETQFSGMHELEASRAINRRISKRTRGIDMLVGTQSKFNRRMKPNGSFTDKPEGDAGRALQQLIGIVLVD